MIDPTTTPHAARPEHPPPLLSEEIADIARLEEHRIARAVAALADVAEPFCGGILARAAPGTWLNSAYGAGLEQALDRASLLHLIDFHAGHGIEPRIELVPFIEPSALQALADLGFVVRGWDSVLARRTDLPTGTDFALPDGVEFEKIDTQDDDAVDAFARMALSGFPAATGDGADASLESLRAAVRLPGCGAVMARSPDGIIGAAAYETYRDVTCLFGASVAPAWRGRGIQRAMILWRLRCAAAHGARWATIGSRPGGPTERNVRRVGFAMAYVRTTFVRPGPGLRPVVE